MFVSRSLLFPHRGGRTEALSSACKIDQADFTDWMSFLTSNFIKEINPAETLSKNTSDFHQNGEAGKTIDLGVNGLISLITYRTFIRNKHAYFLAKL